MEILGVSWIGIRTERFQEIVSFFRQVGLTPRIEESDFVMFKLPDGDQIEVFGPAVTSHAHFTTGPVAGFRVADVATARAELKAAGAKLIGPIHSEGGSAWQHFQGPDGNIYEINGNLLGSLTT
jgi:predicted enzyme related to lactoylglutathione lyase